MQKKYKTQLLIICLTLLTLTFTACSKTTLHKPENSTNQTEKQETEETTEDQNTENNNVSNEENVLVRYEVKKTSDYPVESKRVKLTTIEEWNNYEFNQSLNDTFIKKELEKGRIIYIVQEQLTSGSATIDVQSAEVKENILYVDLILKYPQIGTDDMAGAFYIFSCDKSVTDIMNIHDVKQILSLNIENISKLHHNCTFNFMFNKLYR